MSEEDRELLELAAKAAQLEGEPLWAGEAGISLWKPSTGTRFWNPLTDDGDALRLAVKLGVEIFRGMRDKCVYARLGDVWEEAFVHHDGDKAAATRRAIVRAAAALANKELGCTAPVRVGRITRRSEEMNDEPEWDFWDFWDDSGIHCAGYSSDIDADLIRVFIESDSRDSGRSFYSTEIAARLGLPEKYVELLKYALCSADFCEYGTSPRGAWDIHGKQDELRDKLLKWYEAKWGEALEVATSP